MELAYWGRLDNRMELATALGMAAENPSEPELVLAAWRRWGEDLPSKLLGDFALAIVDASRRVLFLARDPMGVKPLYYLRQGQSVVFASSIPELRRMAEQPLEADEGWIVRYLLSMSASETTAAYRDVRKLAPGCSLSIDGDGRERLVRYHEWRDDAPDARCRDTRWVAAYRAAFEESIRCRMAGHGVIGTENSGGLDSASVTAYLARLLGSPGERLHGFGFAWCQHEPAIIQGIHQALGITREHLITERTEIDDLPARIDLGLRVLGYPEEHSNATGHIPFYRRCRELDIPVLFSGFGGDEVATNPGHLLRQECLDRHRYRELWDILPGRWPRRWLILAKAATIGRGNLPYNRTFFNAFEARWSQQVLSPDVVSRMGSLQEQLLEGARHDAPFRRINDYILNGLLKKPYIVARLENCTLMAAHFGVDYRWPFWDTRLVQQYLSTPSIEKYGPGGVGRYLHRRAMDGIVPTSVAWKPTKYMGEGPLRNMLRGEGLRQLGMQGRSLEADLHPDLAELVDRGKFRQQIKIALEGGDDYVFAVNYRRNVVALSWLDAWLKGVGRD